MSLIKLSNIEFSYREVKSDSDFSLSDINLIINEGDFLSILGPNGSGKSTLIKLITGYLEPQCGEIILDGTDLKNYRQKDIAKKIAYVPQIPTSIYPFSVYEIIAMGRFPYLGISGFEKSEDIAIIDKMIELMELSHLVNKGINEISGGEAQRAFIGRALVQQPKILLLDEPNAHLDIKHQISIFNLLKKLNNKEGITIVTVMHDLNLTSLYSSRVVMLKNGKIFLDGKVNDALIPEKIKNVFEVDVEITTDVNSNLRTVLIKPELERS
ncbi:MAG: ABC transporter ATP-binding protein [Melioribacteraceae bacterium]|nr:ABC transporter ATP-binding protein [Melioribacteraceae bacterium]